MKQANDKWIIKQNVPDEVYTDREIFLDYFHDAALEAAHRRTTSTVLLGQRRMGKTEIFRRVVNRLFFGQDPEDPHAVVPVYHSFPDGETTEKTFGKDYLENFLRYYIAFHTRDFKLVRKPYTGKALVSILEKSASVIPKETVDWLKITHESIENGNSVLPHRDALEVPRQIADDDDITIAVFLDEFQNTRLPQYNFDITGFMQQAVESPNCPHFVTGSAMSILGREIIGRGSLFGRFRAKEIESMQHYDGKELALKAASHYKAEISGLMAPMISNRCGGNPFYITALIKQSAEMTKAISDEQSLNDILAVDITSGFIWGELNDQVTRWIDRINDQNITKWILYLSAMDENENQDEKKA